LSSLIFFCVNDGIVYYFAVVTHIHNTATTTKGKDDNIKKLNSD